MVGPFVERTVAPSIWDADHRRTSTRIEAIKVGPEPPVSERAEFGVAGALTARVRRATGQITARKG